MSAHQGALSILPPVDLARDARAALRGADHHLQELRRLIDDGLPQTAVNPFHYHLRAFFWELVATVDSLLQWINQTEKLGLQERDVKWKSVKEAADQGGPWSSRLEAIRDGFNSAWFFEVREYRNFSHRAFQFVQLERKPNGRLNCIWILPARVGQVPCYDLQEQLAGYGQAMQTLLDTVLPNPPDQGGTSTGI